MESSFGPPVWQFVDFNGGARKRKTPDSTCRDSLTGRAVSLMTEVVDDNARDLEIPEKIEQHCRRLVQALIKPHGITSRIQRSETSALAIDI